MLLGVDLVEKKTKEKTPGEMQLDFELVECGDDGEVVKEAAIR
jgi:hypothetical protein